MGVSIPGLMQLRCAHQHPATAGLRPDDPVGACLHANNRWGHASAVFAAKVAPSTPLAGQRVERSETHQSPAEESSRHTVGILVS
ncbi:MAG: hypothetical protein KGY40_06030, partial [Thioalkalivibrio sp.]|nr:hypothetical protein [Thioalkalivibrio sp.]